MTTADLEKFWKKLGAEPHPVIELPSVAHVRAAQVDEEAMAKLMAYLGNRRELIALMEKNPLEHGWKPDCWLRAEELLEDRTELLVMGGNRSAKTEFAAWYACRDVCFKPNRIWAFLHSSDKSSVRLQQPRIYKYLHPQWRDIGKSGKTVAVSFTEKNGFSDSVFILPNGSRGFFFNYKQDPDVLEGYELDGFWADELIPPNFLLALRFRLITRRGKGLVTFTPVRGYTPTVGEYLSAARIEESLPSELLPGENVKGCPAGQMPYVMQCVHSKRAVIFFFTEFNKFSPYTEMRTALMKDTTTEVKMRAYGWPDRAKGNVFPKFGAHNIITAARFREITGGLKHCTVYHYIDFAWDRNWFMIWIAVTEFKGKKRVIVFGEFPDHGTYSEWVLPSEKADGERGPAQTSLGWGIIDYKKYIVAREKLLVGQLAAGQLSVISGQLARAEALTVYERRCDPRSGAAVAVVEEGGTCLIQMMQEEQSAEAPAMDVMAASGDNILDGVNLINQWLEYDDGRTIDITNEPQFYVLESCQNLIDCLRMYTGQDGQKGACKDPIDTLRYAAQDKIEHVEARRFGSEGGGSY